MPSLFDRLYVILGDDIEAEKSSGGYGVLRV